VCVGPGLLGPGLLGSNHRRRAKDVLLGGTVLGDDALALLLEGGGDGVAVGGGVGPLLLHARPQLVKGLLSGGEGPLVVVDLRRAT